MQSKQATSIRVASLIELQQKGCLVVRGADRPIAVFAHEGRVSAVDNRCPHLGFPLSRGSVQDGILTCHWHHARFDLHSGCTFDLFADDVPAYDVEVRDGIVYVSPTPRQAKPREYFYRRLQEGMAQNIGLIQFKCLIGLLKSGEDPNEIIRAVALFGTRNRDQWLGGLTILTASGNLFKHLDEETGYLALSQATSLVAAECANQPPRRDRFPLESEKLPLDTLKRWLRYWTLVRHRDGAERTLLTAIENGATPTELADLVFSAVTDRFYADGGHRLDFFNKAFELLDRIGWQHAGKVLPVHAQQLVGSRGVEENNAWRHPVDLVPALQKAGQELPALFREGTGKKWDDVRGMSRQLLGDDPLAIIEALRTAIRAGARPDQLTKALAYAAAMRIARFGSANELGDWFTALHTFSYCNALHQVVKRCPTPEIVRGVFHGAMSVNLDRFLNIPPAALPGEKDPLDNEPRDPAELRQRFLDLLDRRDEIDGAVRVVARYVRLGHTAQPLFDTLTRAIIREDMDFHTFQMLEAGIRQYHEWEGQPEAEHILVAVARYVAAFSPTRRDTFHRMHIALRLHRGDALYEEET